MNQTTTALIEHLSHVAEEIAKLKSELQTEKRDWELTNELLKDRIDELQIQAQDKDKEIWKIKQDARDEIFQEREKVVADYMEIIIKKDEEIEVLKNSNEQLKSWVKDHPKIKELEDKLLKKSQEVANIHQKYYELKKKVLAKAIRQEVIGGKE